MEVPTIVESEDEWRKQLGPTAFGVTRRAGTEIACTGAYWNFQDKGLFRCVGCDTALFSSKMKFDFGTGWPSFWAACQVDAVSQIQAYAGFRSAVVIMPARIRSTIALCF